MTILSIHKVITLRSSNMTCRSLSGSALLAAALVAPALADTAPATEDVTVIGKKPDDARSGIQTQTGASTSSICSTRSTRSATAPASAPRSSARAAASSPA